jgi:hypothetical protein
MENGEGKMDKTKNKREKTKDKKINILILIAFNLYPSVLHI